MISIKTLLKVKINKNITRISYKKKAFKNRVEAIKAIINHLQGLLKFYGVKIDD